MMSEIEGVIIKKLTVHPDVPDVEESNVKPGFLMEVVRDDDGLLERFGQSTFTLAHQGTIKGFHWHKRQDDLWFVATGKAVVVLHDLREESRTHGLTQTITAGEDDYKVILIPSGVAHGYKVLSTQPVILFYHTTRSYDGENPDEERIPYNDSGINFDWKGVN